MARRIAALILMQPELDANYEAVKADTCLGPKRSRAQSRRMRILRGLRRNGDSGVEEQFRIGVTRQEEGWQDQTADSGMADYER